MPWQLQQSSNKGLHVKIRTESPAFRVLSAFFFVCVATVSLHFLRIPGNSAPDFPCTTASAEKVNITIAAGESGSSIAQALFTSGVTKSAEAFFRVAVGDVRSQKIAPGNHMIDTHLCATSALDQLLDSSRIAGLINIAEGAWLSEVIPQFYGANFSKAEVTTALKSVIKPRGFTALEGLLFPAQYSFAEGTSATDALQSMVDRTREEMKRAGFSDDKKFSPQQLLIIASLIQAEGNTQDFSKISQVIRNRLAKGMPLQFDSTVHYIKKSRGSVFLSTQSTLINSAYNTYRRYGLPPGPINNPDRKSVV